MLDVPKSYMSLFKIQFVQTEVESKEKGKWFIRIPGAPNSHLSRNLNQLWNAHQKI